MIHTYSILDFGAVPDTDVPQTESIQAAIDRCFAAGGGVVEIPCGTFCTGDIRLRSHITLRLCSGAVLRGSRSPADYFHHRADSTEPLPPEWVTDCPVIPFSEIPNNDHYRPDCPQYNYVRCPASRWNNALIRAFDAEDIAIIGEEGAVIDGTNCFDPLGEESYRGPHGITLFRCSNVRLDGYTIRNTGNWAHNLIQCENVQMSRVTVLAGHDGIHMSVCRNITIEDSEFRTGDDCIAGFANVNTIVRACRINSSCSAFRFGGTNLLVTDCEIFGPGTYGFRGKLSRAEKESGAPSPQSSGRHNMLAAFTYYADFSLPISEQPGNLRIEHCTIQNADRILHYNFSGNETWQKHRPLADITFSDIQATGILYPMNAYGSPDVPLTIVLREVSVRYSTHPESFLRLANFDRAVLERVTVSGLAPDTPLIETWSAGEITLRDVRSDGGAQVQAADHPFFARPI